MANEKYSIDKIGDLIADAIERRGAVEKAFCDVDSITCTIPGSYPKRYVIEFDTKTGQSFKIEVTETEYIPNN